MSLLNVLFGWPFRTTGSICKCNWHATTARKISNKNCFSAGTYCTRDAHTIRLHWSFVGSHARAIFLKALKTLKTLVVCYTQWLSRCLATERGMTSLEEVLG